MTPIRLIVGLGNPGARYAKHRHNVGKVWVEQLALREGATWQLSKPAHGRISKLAMDDQPRYLLCPETYMNESGQSVGGACRYFKIKPEEILVVQDELDLPVGCIRFKQGGGHGGHNGLRSIMAHLNSDAFNRLRIGVGRPQGATEGYVLSSPSAADQTLIEEGLMRVWPMMQQVWAGDMQTLMCHLHGDHKE